MDQETLTEMVKPSVDYVRHRRFRSGNYPSSLSNETDRLVHWCHGAPGVIHMLTQAYKVSPPSGQCAKTGFHHRLFSVTRVGISVSQTKF